MLVAHRVPSSELHDLKNTKNGKVKSGPKFRSAEVKAVVCGTAKAWGKSSSPYDWKKLTVASAVEVVPENDWMVVPSKNQEVDSASGSHRYTLKELLGMRSSWRFGSVKVEEGQDFSRIGPVPTARPAEDASVVPFRAKPTGKQAISFHMDVDVPSNCIVNVLNIDNKVEWPMLQTFCAKTVGVKPLSIRMQRRSNPASAHLLFSSVDEATEFLQRVPPGIRLKGRRPRFLLNDSTVAGGIKGKSADDVEEENGIVTAVVCPDIGSEAVEDDCCKK
mmetsp:Transcript_62739/g.147882  ORF Transcript_62739/g.147882 Transcript_62739/m.147882 type:complete len:276 (-) Transcript_62739:383-1210(-)